MEEKEEEGGKNTLRREINHSGRTCEGGDLKAISNGGCWLGHL